MVADTKSTKRPARARLSWPSAALALLGLGAHAEANLPKEEAPMLIYSEIDFSYTPDPSLPLLFAFVRLHPIGGTPAATPEVTWLSPDGAFHSHLECHFLGAGTLQLFYSPDTSDTLPLIQLPIRCLAPFQGSLRAQSSVLLTNPAEQPTTFAGVVESYAKTAYVRHDELDEGSSPQPYSVATFDETTEDTTLSGDQQCVTRVLRTGRTGQPDQVNTIQGCVTVQANPSSLVLFEMARGHGSVVSQTDSFSGDFVRTTRTETSHANETATIRFPTVPPAIDLSEVRVIGQPVTAMLPASAFKLNGNVLTEVPTGFAASAGCSNGAVTGSGVWVLPAPASGGALSVTTEALALCPTVGNGTAVHPDPNGTITVTRDTWLSRLYGTLQFEGRTPPPSPELIVAPDLRSVTPTNRLVPNRPEVFGTSQTNIRATFRNAQPGSYVARLRIDQFDAARGGHNHGSPPSALWGTTNGELESTCPLEVGEGTSEASCDVKFQSNDVSGIAKLIATIDDQPIETNSEITVEITGLTELLESPSYVLQGASTGHLVNHFGTDAIVAVAPALAARFQELTNARLSINDMSLQRGGLFDVNNDWSHPHRSHRDGRDMDIDRAWFLPDGSTRQVQCEDDRSLRRAAAAAGGNLRCEPVANHPTESIKHIDF